MRFRVDDDLQVCVCVCACKVHGYFEKNAIKGKKDNERENLNAKRSNGLY